MGMINWLTSKEKMQCAEAWASLQLMPSLLDACCIYNYPPYLCGESLKPGFHYVAQTTSDASNLPASALWGLRLQAHPPHLDEPSSLHPAMPSIWVDLNMQERAEENSKYGIIFEIGKDF